MDFNKLADRIQQVNDIFQQGAVRSVNVHLTIRNWVIGFYIVEFEQNGSDRAQYGDRLIADISQTIKIRGLSETNLKLCRQFYNTYPHIISLIGHDLRGMLPTYFVEDFTSQISQTATDQSNLLDNKVTVISQTVSDQLNDGHLSQLVLSISYSHIVELIKIEDSNKRRFYELLILKTQPSVRELKRQINTLTYERVGLSVKHEESLDNVIKKIKPQQTTDLVKSHYIFEFLNIKHPYLIEENELEQALINNLQHFITELGNGFCFEARQKRILLGDEYYFVDLVFYHRILKCHVLIELKTEAAKHEHIGQLKTYINFYKKNIQENNDNPPVGILLVTNQNKAMVEYAIADSDLDIFVSKYQLQLPNKSKLEEFINNELRNI